MLDHITIAPIQYKQRMSYVHNRKQRLTGNKIRRNVSSGLKSKHM